MKLYTGFDLHSSNNYLAIMVFHLCRRNVLFSELVGVVNPKWGRGLTKWRYSRRFTIPTHKGIKEQ